MTAPDCPEHLTGEARREWERIAPELAKLGLLTKIDRAALAGYCSTWQTYVDADRKIREAAQAGKKPGDTGLIVLTKSGNAIPNPFLGVRNTALKLLHKFAREFGFTPGSRGEGGGQPADETPPPGLA